MIWSGHVGTNAKTKSATLKEKETDRINGMIPIEIKTGMRNLVRTIKNPKDNHRATAIETNADGRRRRVNEVRGRED